MTEESASSNAIGLGYTGCQIHLAVRKYINSSVEKAGRILTLEQAVEARRNRKDVVVCGNDVRLNLQIAETIESRATDRNHKYHAAHLEKGKRALPHFQHRVLDDLGHTFYESPPRFLVSNRDDLT